MFSHARDCGCVKGSDCANVRRLCCWITDSIGGCPRNSDSITADYGERLFSRCGRIVSYAHVFMVMHRAPNRMNMRCRNTAPEWAPGICTSCLLVCHARVLVRQAPDVPDVGILTARTWDAMSDLLANPVRALVHCSSGPKPTSVCMDVQGDVEKPVARANAQKYSAEIGDILASCPRELLLMLKVRWARCGMSFCDALPRRRRMTACALLTLC